MKIVAYTKYGSAAASTRQRILQYIPSLTAAGFAVEHRPLLDSDYVASLASGARYPSARIAAAYAARLRDLLRGTDADILWIYAELFPYLPVGFERLALRQGKQVVYDMDDAFFHQYDDNPRPWVRRLLAGKLQPLMSGAALCCCGNAYLEEYAARHARATMILPTVVDTAAYFSSPQAVDDPPVVGWIGSPSTWPYMRPLLPMLAEYAAAGKITVRAVGAGKSAADDAFPGLTFIDWHEKTEIAEIQGMDIGLMPLPDRPWERGKCGYKLIQYMACGLPVIASPIGVNSNIVVPQENGYLATDPAEWRQALDRLIQDARLRARLGLAGRRLVEEHYSLAVQAPRLVDAFRQVIASTGAA